MKATRLSVRRVPGGFVVVRPGIYVFDTDREEARAWAEALERAAAVERRRHRLVTVRPPPGSERTTRIP